MWTWTILSVNEGKDEIEDYMDNTLHMFEENLAAHPDGQVNVELFIFDLTYYAKYRGKFTHRTYQAGKLVREHVIFKKSKEDALKVVLDYPSDGFLFSGHGSGFWLGSATSGVTGPWTIEKMTELRRGRKYQLFVMDACKSMNLTLLYYLNGITRYFMASPISIGWTSFLFSPSLVNKRNTDIVPWMKAIAKEFVAREGNKYPVSITIVDTSKVRAVYDALLDHDLAENIQFNARTREPDKNLGLHDLDKALILTSSKKPHLKRRISDLRRRLSDVVVAKVSNQKAKDKGVAAFTVYSTSPTWIPWSVACRLNWFQISQPAICNKYKKNK